MTTRRFAEDTKVTIEASQSAVKAQLRRAGADQLAVFEGDDKSAVAFRLAGHFYRITVPVRTNTPKARQEARRSWRLLLLLIKAKVEAIREGATTVEREFLADMLLHDGSTVSQWVQPQIDEAQQLGRMPTSLMIEGPKP